MIEGIQAAGLSQLELLRARNAFQNVVRKPNALEAVEEVEEKENIPMPQGLNKETIDSLRGELTNINENITDEDIKYGLIFGRSVLVDCSA